MAARVRCVSGFIVAGLTPGTPTPAIRDTDSVEALLLCELRPSLHGQRSPTASDGR
jgi:hypothetical protein